MTLILLATPKDDDFNTSRHSNVTSDRGPRHEVLRREDSKSGVDQQSRTLPSGEINTKEDSSVEKNLDSDKQDETEKNIDDHFHRPAETSETKKEVSTISVCLETKCEGEKSDSSDSSSWIRVLDKEGI